MGIDSDVKCVCPHCSALASSPGCTVGEGNKSNKATVELSCISLKSFSLHVFLNYSNLGMKAE